MISEFSISTIDLAIQVQVDGTYGQKSNTVTKVAGKTVFDRSWRGYTEFFLIRHVRF